MQGYKSTLNLDSLLKPSNINIVNSRGKNITYNLHVLPLVSYYIRHTKLPFYGRFKDNLSSKKYTYTISSYAEHQANNHRTQIVTGKL